jgi:thiamine kinase-like enzyme
VQCSSLSEGLLNRSFRVRRDGASFLLRVPKVRGDFGFEFALLREAARRELSPPVRHADAADGVLLLAWAAGRTPGREEFVSAAGMTRIAGLLLDIHGLAVPQPPRRLDAAAWVAHYATALGDRVGPPPSLYGEARRYLEQLKRDPPPLAVVCHSDLHVGNLLMHEDTQRPLLLDWEYAHVNEPLWDLAGWSANNDFEVPEQQALLRSYLGRAPCEGEWRRFGLLSWLYDFVCLQWNLLYVSQQPGRRDLRGRAEHLERRLTGPVYGTIYDR